MDVALPKRLKVLALTHGGIKHATGRQRYQSLFSRRDIDLTLVVPDRWHDYKKIITPDPPIEGTNVLIEKIRLAHFPKVEWYLHYYPNLTNIVKTVQPDVIHLWEEPWAVVSLQAAFARNRYAPNAALLLETDQNIFRKLPFPFEYIRKRMLRETDLMIGRNDEALAVNAQHGYKGRTSIVEYGIERSNFTPGGKEVARKEFNIQGFTIGYVGRLVSYKGLDDVLYAMKMCDKKIYFHLLGDGPYKAQFLNKVKELGLADYVKLFEARPASEVAHFMKSLDALVLMSRTTKTWKEQFGRVIMEAQACGVPVIGSDSGSIPSVIGPGGWFVKEGDSVALSALLCKLVEYPDLLAVAGKAGLYQADTRFNFDVIGEALLSSYVGAFQERLSYVK